jgi:hypothetical protein
VVVYPDSQAALTRIRDFRFGNRFHSGPIVINIITAQRKFQGKWPPKPGAFDVALGRRFPRRHDYQRPGSQDGDRTAPRLRCLGPTQRTCYVKGRGRVQTEEETTRARRAISSSTRSTEYANLEPENSTRECKCRG